MAPAERFRYALPFDGNSDRFPRKNGQTGAFERFAVIDCTGVILTGSVSIVTLWRVCVMENLLSRFLREEQGQDLIEYGLLLGIITVAAIVGIGSIGSKVGAYFSNLNSALP